MPHADPLPSQVLEHIAGQLGVDVVRAFGENVGDAKSVQLMESFMLWALDTDAITRGKGDFAQRVRPTGLWHHQIKINGKAKGAAQSAPIGPDAQSWRVECVIVSALAQKIDEAITWVDKHVKKDSVVRLLAVPSYHLHAFWFHEGQQNQVLVVAMPASFTHLALHRLYSSKEFVETLLKEQHVIGISRG